MSKIKLRSVDFYNHLIHLLTDNIKCDFSIKKIKTIDMLCISFIEKHDHRVFYFYLSKYGEIRFYKNEIHTKEHFIDGVTKEIVKLCKCIESYNILISDGFIPVKIFIRNRKIKNIISS